VALPLFLLGTACLLGCVDGSDARPPSSTDGTLALVPSDLSTDVPAGALEIRLYTTAELPDSIPEALSQSATLRTFPDGSPVSFSLTWTNGTALPPSTSSPPNGNPGPVPQMSDHVSVFLTPDPPLGDGWYEFGLSSVPDFAGVNLVSDDQEADGSLLARFTLSSDPILSALSACAKTDENLRVVLQFSESIPFASFPGGITLTDSTVGYDCDMLPATRDGSPAAQISADCRMSTLSSSLSLSIQSLTAVSGKAVSLMPQLGTTDSSGKSLTVDLGSLPQSSGEPCKTWHPLA
jgi:hypothetical protein